MLYHVFVYVSSLFIMFTLFKLALLWYATDIFSERMHDHMQAALAMQAEYNAHSILNSTLNQAQTFFGNQQHMIDFYS